MKYNLSNQGFTGDGVRCEAIDKLFKMYYIKVLNIFNVDLIIYVENTKSSQVTASLPIPSDIDECSADPSPCDENADCINVNGSYSCTCKQGFTGNGSHCEGKYADHFR